MEVRTEIEIEAPVEEVFDAVLDPMRLEEWVTAHREIVETPDVPLEEGSEFRQKLRVAGVSFKVTWHLRKLRRPELVEWEGDGPAGSKARACYSFDAVETGTRFSYVNEFEMPGGKIAAKAASVIGEERGRQEAERSLANLKKLLEA